MFLHVTGRYQSVPITDNQMHVEMILVILKAYLKLNMKLNSNELKLMKTIQREFNTEEGRRNN